MNLLTFFLLSLGKRKRVPTQKALEADIDLTLKNLKDEGNQESDIESAAKIAKTDEEDDSTEVSKEVIYSDKENTTPIDSKLEVKLDVKPGDVKSDVKVKKPRANIPCPRCGKLPTEETLKTYLEIQHKVAEKLDRFDIPQGEPENCIK